ncbi:MAG: MATE family efflux transporter [Alteromonadaceae bacterium]
MNQIDNKIDKAIIPPSLWRLAWPTTIANLLLASVGFIQILLSTQYGTEATAAVTVSQRIFFLLQASLFGLSAGVSAIIARNIGANEQQRAGQAFQSALLLSFMLSIVLAISCYIFAYELTSLFKMKGETQLLAIKLIKWICLFSPIYSLNIIMAGSLRASGDAFHPLMLAIISGVGNGVGCYLLSTGSLGIEGLVIGGVFGSCISLVFYSYLWRKNYLSISYPEESKYRKKTLLLLKIGMPSALEQLLLQVGFVIFTIAIASYGSDVLAAYGLGLNVLTLILITSLAFSMSGAVIVGQYLGRGEPEVAYQQGWRAWRICVSFLSFFGVIFFFYNQEIAALLTSDINVQNHTANFLLIIAFSMPLIATDFTIGGAIRGAGETTYPLMISLITLLLVRIILPFIFIKLNFSITALFILTGADFFIKAIFMTLYFRKRKWQNKVF